MEYTIERGDTLARIARSFNTTVAAILAINASLGNGDLIRIGQVIRIPQQDAHRRPAATGAGRPALAGAPAQVAEFPENHLVAFPQPSPSGFLQGIISSFRTAALAAAAQAANTTPWMDTAQAEIGVAEFAGMHSANPRILEYFTASRYWGTDDTSGVNAWCGSFAAWVMTQHGYTPPRASFRARSWKNFGKRIEQPVYGAIGVKSRRGGGHVSFVMGRNETGDRLYMLGGNQDDLVQVSEYPRSVWTDFMVPANFDETSVELPLYTESSAAAGREG